MLASLTKLKSQFELTNADIVSFMPALHDTSCKSVFISSKACILTYA